jgi:hypothetical protein
MERVFCEVGFEYLGTIEISLVLNGKNVSCVKNCFRLSYLPANYSQCKYEEGFAFIESLLITSTAGQIMKTGN